MNLSRRRLLLGGLLLSGAGLAWVRLPRAAAPIWMGTALGRLVPARFGPWQSSDDDAQIVLPAADEEQAEAIYDSQLARVYRRAGLNAAEAGASAAGDVLLVVACSLRQNEGLLVHRPESCYPGAGFTITADRPQMVPLAGGRQVAARYLTAESEDRIEQVLYWIRIGNTYPLSPLAERWAAAGAALAGEQADGALVRVSLVSRDADAALADLLRFAAGLYAAADARGRDLMARG